MLEEPLAEAFEAHAHELAIVSASQQLTYAELQTMVHADAARLHALGLRRGEVAAMRLRPSMDAVSLLLACFSRGVIAAPLNDRLPPEGLAEAIAAIGARLCILHEAVPAPLPCRAITHDEFAAATPGAPELPAAFDGDAPAVLVFTSGSTGAPKAAALSFNNHAANAMLSQRNIPATPGDRWLLSLPLYHVSGLSVVFRCFLHGGAIAIPEGSAQLAEAIHTLGATHVSLVAAQMTRLMASPDGHAALARLKHILLGGSALPETLLQAAHASGLPVHKTYGLTEAASQVATTALGELLGPARLLDAGSVRTSAEGVIEISGPTRFLGYWHQGELTQAFVDGWFSTGDLGRIEDGHLQVHGRRDNMFISGGENIQPEEIERALLSIPGVAEAVAVPVPHATFGQRPVAFVRCEHGPADAAKLRAALSERLPKYKVPDAVYNWPDDLVTPGIKPRRIDLQRYAEKLTRP